MKKVLRIFDDISGRNHLLKSFSAWFTIMLSSTAMGLLSVFTGLKADQLLSFLLLILLMSVAAYKSHHIYHAYVREKLLSLGWKEDSFLHGILLLILLMIGVMLPLQLSLGWIIGLFRS